MTRGVAAVELQLVIWNLDLGPDVDMRTLQRPVVPMISYRAVRLSALSDAAVKALRAQNTAQLATVGRPVATQKIDICATSRAGTRSPARGLTPFRNLGDPSP